MQEVQSVINSVYAICYCVCVRGHQNKTVRDASHNAFESALFSGLSNKTTPPCFFAQFVPLVIEIKCINICPCGVCICVLSCVFFFCTGSMFLK